MAHEYYIVFETKWRCRHICIMAIEETSYAALWRTRVRRNISFIAVAVPGPKETNTLHIFMHKIFFFAVLATIVIANACNQEGTPGMQVPGKSGVPDSALAGKTMFEASCVRCHGMDASGLSGPSLKRPQLSHATDLESFTKVVITGISGTGMPGHWDLTDTDCAHLYAYISYLRKQGMETPAGDTAAGRLVYNKSICISCHVYNGEGTSIGPELSNIGASRSPSYLRQALIDPGAALPESTDLVNGYGFSLYLPVKIVTKEGKEITGLRVNEDTYTIQVKDLSNNYYSFDKDDLASLEKVYHTSLMPSFKNTLTDEEIENLVAFLYKSGN